MKILIYSDLHLEFGSRWNLPSEAEGDIIILAGDIISFEDYGPLDDLLGNWNKPVLYVTGNHEYYTETPMDREDREFAYYLEHNHPNVKLLFDESVTLGGIHFFGGTMWTDFDRGNKSAMMTARSEMNDFRLIRNSDASLFTPMDAEALHRSFVAKLLAWFDRDLAGPRVVITHTAPVMNPRTRFRNSPLRPAFNSLDMTRIIRERQPALWVYGHTHECDDQTILGTRIVSNQLGYPLRSGGFECKDFDPMGAPVALG